MEKQIWEQILEITKNLTEKDFEGLPSDLSIKLDTYLVAGYISSHEDL
jgi:hypothetical protein